MMQSHTNIKELLYVWTRDMYIVFWWGNLKARDYLEDQIVDGSMTLIWTLMK